MRLLRAAALLACLLSVSAAAAEPTAADKETARALMRKGDAAFDAGDYKSALASYKAGHAIMGVPTTGLALARAQERLGQLVEARDTALAVSRRKPEPDEPFQFADARAQAVALTDGLARRIPSVEIHVRGVASGTEVRVTIDGEALPAGAEAAPRKLNPGRHRIAASAGGYGDAASDVTVAEREQKVVELALAPVGPGAVAPEAPPPPPSRGVPVVAVVGFGIGLAGITVGSITGVLSLNKTSEIKGDCPTNETCAPSRQGDLDDADTLARASNVAFIVGGAGIVVGVLGLVLRKPAPAASAPASARLRASASGVGFAF